VIWIQTLFRFDRLKIIELAAPIPLDSGRKIANIDISVWSVMRRNLSMVRVTRACSAGEEGGCSMEPTTRHSQLQLLFTYEDNGATTFGPVVIASFG
jgi:hypothetical protein